MAIFRILRRQHLIAFLDSIDSVESTDSIDIIDSIDSILVPHKETANIHTTHKGRARCARARTKVPMGLRPIGTFVFPLCVVWMLAVSLCGTSIESIESIISIESVDSVQSIESRKMFFERADLQQMWFFSARTSKKVFFQRADLQKHDFEKSFLSPDSNSWQKVTSNALVDS